MTSSNLKAMQGILARLIASPSSLDEGQRDGGVQGLIKPSARGMKPVARVEVYRLQFWTRHIESLQDDFPTLIWAMGGRKAFQQLAADYLATHPPGHWDLQRLGGRLPDYLATVARWGSDEIARAAARLDWAFMEAFDAPDAAPVDPSALASMREDEWPRATVLLHPSLRLLAIDYALHLTRSDLTAGRTPARPARTPTHIAVWRDRVCVLQAISIGAGAFGILTDLKDGVPLGRACESAAQATGADADALDARIGAWFQEWTTRGWISAVTAHLPGCGAP